MPTNRLLPGLTLLASLVAFAGIGCSAEGGPEDEDNIVTEDEDVGESTSALCTNKKLSKAGALDGLPSDTVRAVLQMTLEGGCKGALRGTPSNFQYGVGRGYYAASVNCRVCK